MKKETFLNIIQGEARWPGEAQKVWGVAIKIDEKDPRWADIYDESESPVEAMRQFKKYFLGIEPQPKQRRKRRTQVERWTEAIGKTKGQMATSAPDEVWIYEERIEALGKKLAHALKNNL